MSAKHKKHQILFLRKRLRPNTLLGQGSAFKQVIIIVIIVIIIIIIIFILYKEIAFFEAIFTMLNCQ